MVSRVGRVVLCAGFLVSGLLVAVGGSAQESAGVVAGAVHAEGGAPLGGVMVRLVSGVGGTLTDGEGRFEIRGVRPGRHILEFTRLGYAPVVREIDLGLDGGDQVRVTMVSTPLSLPGVQVTGRPSGGGPVTGTRPVTQLHGRALERSLGGSVAATLSDEPGMGVRYNGPGAAVPIVRGLTGDRLVLLQDGQRSGDLSGSADDHGMTVDPLAAQRIEVVRGPAALMYGNNALGGVVNVITGEPPGFVPTRVEWRVAVQGESATPGAAVMARGTVPVAERWALGVRANIREVGDVRLGREPGSVVRLGNTDRRTGEGSVGIAYLGSGLSAGVGLRGHGFAYGLPVPPGGDAPIRLEGRIGGITAQSQVALPARRFPMLKATVGATDYAHEELESGSIEMAFGLRTGTGDVLLSQGPWGPMREGAWGISVLRRQYVATGAEQLTAPAETQTFGLFVYQETSPIASRITFQIGGRADRFSITSLDDPRFGAGLQREFAALSGSAGLNLRIAEGVALAGSASRAFRAPTVEELFSDALHLGVAAYEVGDPMLVEERATGFDVLIRAERPGWRGELASFRNGVDGYVHLQARGDTVLDGTRWPVLGYGQGDAVLRGFEASAEIRLPRDLVVGVRGDLVRARLRAGDPLPFTPAPRAGLSLRWDRGDFSAGGSARHAFPQRRIGLEDEVPTDAHTLVGLEFGGRRMLSGRSHGVAARVENLFDVAYRDAASRIKSFAPGPGRNLVLTYTVAF